MLFRSSFRDSSDFYEFAYYWSIILSRLSGSNFYYWGRMVAREVRSDIVLGFFIEKMLFTCVAMRFVEDDGRCLLFVLMLVG